jgi:hypothetical protein
VLITTDKNKEKNCVRDAYNILNDAVEQLYPDLKQVEIAEGKIQKKQKISESEEKVTKSGQVSDLLDDELNKLRNNKTKLFFNFETNCKGVVFIKIDKEYRDLIDIKLITNHIIENIKKTKEQLSKNIARFVPVEIAMKAKLDLFQKHAPSILDKYFCKENYVDGPKTTWRLEIKVRNNNSIRKDDYLEYLLSRMDRELFQVDYKTPQFVILVEITNDLLCMSVLENYNENKSYNLLTLSKSDEELKLERERLMNKQREREEEKKRISEANIKIETTINKSEEGEEKVENDVVESDVEDIELI